MIYMGLGFILIVLLIVWISIKLLRSSKFDKFCNDMADGKMDNDEPTTKDTMKDITTAEKDLGKQAEINTKAAEKLKDESKGINNFLGKRGVGVSSTEKGEDS